MNQLFEKVLECFCHWTENFMIVCFFFIEMASSPNSKGKITIIGRLVDHCTIYSYTVPFDASLFQLLLIKIKLSNPGEFKQTLSFSYLSVAIVEELI